MVAIVGQAATTAIGGHYQQEIDLGALFPKTCKKWPPPRRFRTNTIWCTAASGIVRRGFCPAVPYAIAAKFAFPERVAIALTGDGAMQMNGLAEMITIQKYWKQWSDPRLVILVLNNLDLNQVSWEMRVESGEPKFKASQELPDFPYAEYARMLGFVGVKVERREDVGPAWDRVLSADRPALLEAWVDPNVSIVPPQITFEQAKNFASTLAKGDPDELGIMLDNAKSALAGLLPTRRGNAKADG